jgi:hypothetical protein
MTLISNIFRRGLRLTKYKEEIIYDCMKSGIYSVISSATISLYSQ